MITINDLNKLKDSFKVYGFVRNNLGHGIELKNITYPFILIESNLSFNCISFQVDSFIIEEENKLIPVFKNLDSKEETISGREDVKDFLSYSVVHPYYYLPKINYSSSGIMHDKFYDKLNIQLKRLEKVINDFYLTLEEAKAVEQYIREKFYKI